jgi:hypothetical protein
MVRVLTLSAFAALGFAVPAMADDAANFDPAKSAAFGAELTNAATAQQARLQLAHQGYTGISALDRDGTGRWFGTAQKNGKTVFVGVVLPRPAPEAVTN